VRADVEAAGRRALFLNRNAVDPEARAELIELLSKACEGGPRVRVLLHSLAFGTLKPVVAEVSKDAVSPAQMAMTLDVMATSLVDWTQALLAAGLLERGGRVFSMTSAGGHRAWQAYGPVSAAKAALEALTRQLALELAPWEITANAVCAGVTQTPALAKIPGSDRMLQMARERNPRGRLTTPEDVAGALVALSRPEAGWISGNVINVDGAEDIVA
jgi:NAD(P)-dependent dehydrogenase (short-subunit alcohol dehydrogenase family)